MLKIKKLKFLSILCSALFIFSFSFISKANAATLNDNNVLNVIQDLDNIQVKDLTAKSVLTEESTEAYIPDKLNNIISPKSIIGTDDRYQITDTRQFPYSAICYIEITFPNDTTYIGTAWMYGNNVTITAGHCVYSSEDGG